MGKDKSKAEMPCFFFLKKIKNTEDYNMTNQTTKAIGKKRKKNGFTQISNALLEDSRLSWKAKGLLCYMLSRPNNWKINKSDLQNRATDGREALQNGINELKQFGYLHIYRNRLENGSIDGWVWEYDDTPFEAEQRETRITENQQEIEEIVLESRMTEKPYDGKTVLRESRTYNNTDFNNTDFNNTDSKEIIKNISPKESKKNKKEELEEEFEILWKLYPRKEGKTDAKKHYLKARKNKTSYETVKNGLYRYKEYLDNQGTESQFIPMGSSWFCQERWNDEYTIAPTKNRKMSLMDMYRRDFGGNNNEPARNASVFDHDENCISEHISQSSRY
jgi:hypothetical protein